jgi:hypothetical protein
LTKWAYCELITRGQTSASHESGVAVVLSSTHQVDLRAAASRLPGVHLRETVPDVSGCWKYELLAKLSEQFRSAQQLQWFVIRELCGLGWEPIGPRDPGANLICFKLDLS